MGYLDSGGFFGYNYWGMTTSGIWVLISRQHSIAGQETPDSQKILTKINQHS